MFDPVSIGLAVAGKVLGSGNKQAQQPPQFSPNTIPYQGPMAYNPASNQEAIPYNNLTQQTPAMPKFGVPNGYMPPPTAPSAPRYSPSYGYINQRAPSQPWGAQGTQLQNDEWSQYYNYAKGSPVHNFGMLAGRFATTGRWGT